ncbi:MAG: CBS domain-containing protein [Flavobacteriaceae bacterium]|nr:CBS domain-containing protein [Flavobacteriaceae bacterium]
MKISEYISKDITALNLSATINEVITLFGEVSYSHLPIVENNLLIGLVAESDILTIEETTSPLKEYNYLFDHFSIKYDDNWIDILNVFAASDTNLLPVLTEENQYLGYYELNDVLRFFSDTPLLNEDGCFIILEKGLKDYSFSEISQITESNDVKLIGVFISGYHKDMIRITLRISGEKINDVIQAYRRYGYNLLTKHKEDVLLEELKDRSDYLQKYINM